MLTCFAYLSFVFFVIGPLGKLPLEIVGVNIYLADLAIGTLGLIWLIKYKLAYKLLKSDKICRAFILFVFLAFLSWIFSPVALSAGERIISFMYWLRLVAYFSLYITFRYLLKSNLIKHGNIVRYLIFSGLILALVGWMQYFLYPDLRNLSYLGWDPHYKRIFATFFDPNYFGLLMVITLILLISAFRVKIIYFLFVIFIFLTLLFTYSRSSFLALFISLMVFLAARKKYKFIPVILVVLAVSLMLLPRNLGGEGVKLERLFSVEQRINNWKEALFFGQRYPLLGVGFNTLRYARREYGFIDASSQDSHAAAGVDNSFLFVLATMGVAGLASYIFMLSRFFRQAKFIGKIILIAVVIHSLFLNSLFYPWVMYLLWIILA